MTFFGRPSEVNETGIAMAPPYRTLGYLTPAAGATHNRSAALFTQMFLMNDQFVSTFIGSEKLSQRSGGRQCGDEIGPRPPLPPTLRWASSQHRHHQLQLALMSVAVAVAVVGRRVRKEFTLWPCANWKSR